MPDDNAQAVENKETAPVSGAGDQGGTPPAAAAPADGTPTAPASGTPGTPAAPADTKPGDASPAAPAAADGAKPADDKAKVGETDWTAITAQIIAQFPADQQDKIKELAKTRPPVEVYRAAAAAQSKITELSEAVKGRVKVPGKDAKPEEIAEFRKAIGVPEAADKYEITAPEGMAINPAIEGKAREAFFGLGMTQQQVDGALKLQAEANAVIAQEEQRAIETAAQSAQDDLRIHWGVKEYAPKVEMLNRYVAEMAKQYGQGFADTFNERFKSGIAVGERPEFLKWLDEHVVSKWADDNGIPRGLDSGGGVSDEARKTEILRMAHGTPQEQADYASPRLQDELKGIIARQQRQGKTKAA